MELSRRTREIKGVGRWKVVLAQHCQACGQPFKKGERVISRPGRRKQGVPGPRLYFHEACWRAKYV
jgi:hypothetical protein